MSQLNKLKGVRASRWMLIVAVAALIPLTAGCMPLGTGDLIWNIGYAYDMLFIPVRAAIGTNLLDFINTH